jgi:site-specific DNA-methyltransferase (adenine-specific)
MPEPYYQDEWVTLYHADCRDLLQTFDRKPWTVVTDPPYGYAHASNRADSKWRNEVIANDGDTLARDWMLNWAYDQPALVFGSWKTPAPEGTRAVLVWDKGPASGMGDLALPWKGSFELIYVIGQGFHGHRGEGVLKGYNVVTWASKGRSHPNAKPVDLMRALIAKCPASPIIDPFAGSGSTLRAAKDLGRRAIGIEIDERWCEVAARRLSQEVLAL